MSKDQVWKMIFDTNTPYRLFQTGNDNFFSYFRRLCRNPVNMANKPLLTSS